MNLLVVCLRRHVSKCPFSSSILCILVMYLMYIQDKAVLVEPLCEFIPHRDGKGRIQMTWT